MCNEDNHHMDRWLSCCLVLTSERLKAFRSVNTPIASAAKKVYVLAILFTSAEIEKNVVNRPIQNYINFK